MNPWSRELIERIRIQTEARLFAEWCRFVDGEELDDAMEEEENELDSE